VTQLDGNDTGNESVESTVDEVVPEEAKFTQSDLNRLLKERLAREKAKYADYDKLKQAAASNQSDFEKAIAAARDEGIKSARSEAAKSLVAAKIEAALTGLVDDPAELVADIDLSKYLDDNGEVDFDAIKSLKNRYAKLFAGNKAPNRTGHGRTNGATKSNSATDDFVDTIGGLFS
jgi:hypothetical protein